MGRASRRLLMIAALLAPAGCQDGESGVASCEDEDAPRECECMAGVTGASTCQGGAWQPCDCDVAEERVCAPGAELACSCEGELQGVQRCLDDGAGWSRCDCAEGDEGEGGDDDACELLVPVGAACEGDSGCGVDGLCMHTLGELLFPDGYCTADPATAGCCPASSEVVHAQRLVAGDLVNPLGENCTDGIDNDDDGDADCADADCLEVVECTQRERLPDDCSNGEDDDGDQLVDCFDPDCGGVFVCHGGTAESDDTLCANREDDDGDGLRDCVDPDCFGTTPCPDLVEDCTNGRDDDGDGLIDCQDRGCSATPACSFQPPDENAIDVERCIAACVEDEDCRGDGKYICGLGLCVPTPDGQGGPPEGGGIPEDNDVWCQDGRDNDGDEAIDCDDPDCTLTSPCDDLPDENTDEMCSDGIDNDQDGQPDCQDQDCRRLPICRGDVNPPEGSANACADGEDNDGDGLADCDDLGCRFVARCQPPGPSEESNDECQDDDDNDFDGRRDCDDPD